MTQGGVLQLSGNHSNIPLYFRESKIKTQWMFPLLYLGRVPFRIMEWRMGLIITTD